MLRPLVAAAVLAWAVPAAAHIALTSPPPRTTELKSGPCGALNSVRGTNVTVLAPGATIDVTWKETINHPGHYRISFDPTGQNFTVPLAFDDTSQTMNVLVDNIPDSPTANDTYTKSITLPNIECETCTLQVIQMMTDKPPYGDGNDIYYQCADIALRTGTPPPPDAGVPVNPGSPDAGTTPTPEDPGTVSGGCHAAGGGSALLGLALVPLWRRRRARS
ncbi:MAG: lytic polysaccharide monooxygenase [Deltaproteobacteria bacterium]|nr:lytic polysaccharide monooxygenase [Deltaproteobacteria bacterium]